MYPTAELVRPNPTSEGKKIKKTVSSPEGLRSLTHGAWFLEVFTAIPSRSYSLILLRASCLASR